MIYMLSQYVGYVTLFITVCYNGDMYNNCSGAMKAFLSLIALLSRPSFRLVPLSTSLTALYVHDPRERCNLI